MPYRGRVIARRANEPSAVTQPMVAVGGCRTGFDCAGSAIYLAAMSASDEGLAGCSGSGAVNCEDVLGSRWSQWLGIPVSYPAIGVYVAILAASAASRWSGDSAQGLAEIILLVCSLMAAGASLWFIFLQALVIGKFCLYCMLCHLCGLTMGGLVLWPVLRDVRQTTGRLAEAQLRPMPRARSAGSLGAAGLARSLPWVAASAAVGVLALVLGQLAVRPQTFVISDMAGPPDRSAAVAEPATAPTDDNAPSPNDLVLAVPTARGETPGSASVPADPLAAAAPASADGPEVAPPVDNGAKHRTISVSLAQGPVALDVYDHPLLGSPTAPHVAIQLFDYTCPQCRQVHQHFEQVRARYGNQLAILVLPVPLASQCNRHIPQTHSSHAYDCRYARLALAVWRLRPADFEPYHRWLMEGQQVPPFDAAARRDGTAG